MKNQWQKMIKKGNGTKVKIIIAIILSLVMAIIIAKSHIVTSKFTWDAVSILSVIFMFLFLHVIFPLKSLYEFIYQKRYLLALTIFIYIVMMSYSGSSIGAYHAAIQPQQEDTYYTPIFGLARPIRSDEWNVNTPIAVSQVVDKENPFAYYNDNLRGTATEMFSIAASPVADILILAKPFFIGFLLFGAEHGLAFLWYGRFIALMLVSFEFSMLISNKKKLISLLGMILIVFSAATQWWYITDFVIWGGLALVLMNQFMLTKKYYVKILDAFGIFISAISYIFILYPAWQLTYGYVFLAIFIWILWKNRKVYHIKLKDGLLIAMVILAVIGIGIRYYSMSKDVMNIVMNTDYPGERFELGGGGKEALFSYVYSMFFPYIETMPNPCEASGMLSIYPIPMVIAVIFLINSKERKKHFAFLIPMLMVSLLFSIWSLTTTSEWLAKLTFLSMAPGSRVAIPLGFAQILLMIYVMSYSGEKEIILKDNLVTKILAIVVSIGIMHIAINADTQNVMGNLKSYICGFILLVEIYLLFTIHQEKSKQALIALLIPIALITGATVNPIQKGIGVLTQKPIAKKVQEIVREDADHNRWLSEVLPNYFLASGAKVINSVNTYPNFELFQTILKDRFEQEEYRKIYNRYAHIYLQIVEGENDITLLQADVVIIKINPQTIKELGVKYVIASTPLEQFSNETIDFQQIYSEYGLSIYQVNY